MKRTLASTLSTALLGCALMTPVVMMAAQDHDDHHVDRGYYDKKHNDYHKWDDHEDKAYRIYMEQQHRKYVDFKEMNAHDQAAYWNWRHSHSDVVLKIG